MQLTFLIALNKLGDLFGFCGSKWCIVGDFNIISSQAERAPLRRSNCSMRMFNELIEGGNWINPPLLNGLFAWANGRARSRLDRVLLSSGWIQLFLGGRFKSHFGSLAYHFDVGVSILGALSPVVLRICGSNTLRLILRFLVVDRSLWRGIWGVLNLWVS